MFSKTHFTTDEFNRINNLIAATGGEHSAFIKELKFPITVDALNTTVPGYNDTVRSYTYNSFEDIINSGALDSGIARMNANRTSYVDKEFIVADMFDLYKDDDAYGYDAVTRDGNTFIEIKSERINYPIKQSKKLVASATFSAITAQRLINWTADNPMMYQCGYANEHLIYVISFEFKHIAKHLGTQLSKKNAVYKINDLLANPNFECKIEYVTPFIQNYTMDMFNPHLRKLLKI